MNLCDLDLQGVCTIAPGFVTRHEADKTTNTAVTQNFIAEDCWLAAAVESLRQENNQRAFKEVVQTNGNNLEFRWEFQYFTLLKVFKFCIHLSNPNHCRELLAGFLYFLRKIRCVVSPCLYLCPSKYLFNKLLDFHRTWFNNHVTMDHFKSVLYNFLPSTIIPSLCIVVY